MVQILVAFSVEKVDELGYSLQNEYTCTMILFHLYFDGLHILHMSITFIRWQSAMWPE